MKSRSAVLVAMWGLMALPLQAAQQPATLAEDSATLAAPAEFMRWINEQSSLDYTRLRLGRDTFEVVLRRSAAGQNEYQQENRTAEHKLMVDGEGNAFLTLQNLNYSDKTSTFLYQKRFFELAGGLARPVPSLGLYYERLVLPYVGFFKTLNEVDPPSLGLRLQKEAGCDRLRFEAVHKLPDRLRRYRGSLCLRPGSRQVLRGELSWQEEQAQDGVTAALQLALTLRELGKDFRLIPPGFSAPRPTPASPPAKGKKKKP